MRLIVLHGLPAVGKLTVARELARLTGYRLFHNHLVVDALLAIFEFGSPEFVELREAMWLSVFDRAAIAGIDGMIFTFVPESTVRQRFIDQMRETVTSRGGAVDFVELRCEAAELERRLVAPSRRAHGKLMSVDLFRDLSARGAFSRPTMPRPAVAIDTTLHDATTAATRIVAACGISAARSSTTRRCLPPS